MTKIAVIIGSTRPNRFGPKVAAWFMEVAIKSNEAEFELVDIADYNLPILDENVPSGNSQEHTRIWQAKMGEFDGFVIITAEHNHSFPASLKNAIDFVNNEFSYKPVAYVGYGGEGAVRAVEQLRQIAATFRQYDLKPQVVIAGQGNFTDVDTDFVPGEKHLRNAEVIIKEISFWAREMASIREKLKT